MKALAFAHEPVQRWFERGFEAPTDAQTKGWAAIATGESVLLLAPTGSGKTLAAFLTAIDRLMFSPEPAKEDRLKVLYVTPLKALGVDIERNLAAPIAGIRAVAEQLGTPHRVPIVGVRSGDTPQKERARIARQPPDILITTPESLYLLLTSQSRAILAGVETVIVDEIHSMVPTKRGTHLFTSLERLEDLRARAGATAPLQRIGLSATQRPLDEIARLLAGGTIGEGHSWNQRPVRVVDAGSKRRLDIKIEVPVEDISKEARSEPASVGPSQARGGLEEPTDELRSGPAAAQGPKIQPSIWPSIHPRLVALIKDHRSTMIFTNSRRLAERLASALNDLAGSEIALAHHGSISKEQRRDIEERLKQGKLPAIVATSSLELGIDMGAVDLVVQIEAPPSVAAGLQRIGRANHQVGAEPKGVLFPKFRGDLLACAAAGARMLEGKVEETFYPRNPLDVLAQQIVATVAVAPTTADALYDLIRRAAPYADLPRASFDGVLDMLAGRYPSDDFAELRPRLTWDRVSGELTPRQGARRIAIVNGGTIPDRGLYGVFLAEGVDAGGGSRRVGELDEEMVFESRPGEVFLLGAASWRIEDITHDRVLVTPAPGEPGKMPFWRGDRPGRPAELGRAIGELSRKLVELDAEKSTQLLVKEHKLEPRAAKNLVQYQKDELEATGEVPSDRTLVLERFQDEIGDWRVCLLSPFGARVHAPWGTAVISRFREHSEAEVDVNWSDDGIIFRFPAADRPPDPQLFLPHSDQVQDLITKALDQTSLFAARFRENAGRALLFTKRQPGVRMPLWQLRRRAASLLAIASNYPSFPIVLETYREVLRDVFDLGALTEILRQVESRKLRVAVCDTRGASPYASSLMFNYASSFMYDGDAPPAERRAQALALDHAQLRQLLGEAEMRKLLDPEVVEAHELKLQRLDGRFPLKHLDAVHDTLLSLGDLTRDEIAARSESPRIAREWIAELIRARRVIEIRIAGEVRCAAIEDAGRYRDALGCVPPPGTPVAFLEPVPDALGVLLARYARTHGPFPADRPAARFGLGVSTVRTALARLVAAGKLVEGELLPRGRGVEWCDAEVLKSLKRQSLARLKKEVEPVEPAVLGRFLPDWHGIGKKRKGLDALLSIVEKLQGAPIPASVLEAEVLPARLRDYRMAELDELCAAGEVLWRGVEPIGTSDGRIALFLTDHYPRLAPPPVRAEGEREAKIRDLLARRGASFFGDLLAAVRGFPQDVLHALWALVWAGEVTNDTMVPLRSLLRGPPDDGPRKLATRHRAFRSRRLGPPGSEGRWSLLSRPDVSPAPSATERLTALAFQLLERHGVLTREAVQAEGLEGGFGALYPVLKAMEEAGRIRRGYYVAGLGAAQFAMAGADERLRAKKDAPSGEEEAALVLAASDPANPYGAALPWPDREGARPQRSAGAQVVLHNGALIGWVGRSQKSVLTFLPADEPDRTHAAAALARALSDGVEEGDRRALLVAQIDGADPGRSPLAPALEQHGFRATPKGWLKRRSPPINR